MRVLKSNSMRMLPSIPRTYLDPVNKNIHCSCTLVPTAYASKRLVQETRRSRSSPAMDGEREFEGKVAASNLVDGTICE